MLLSAIHLLFSILCLSLPASCPLFSLLSTPTATETHTAAHSSNRVPCPPSNQLPPDFAAMLALIVLAHVLCFLIASFYCKTGPDGGLQVSFGRRGEAGAMLDPHRGLIDIRVA
jgi:hypothetical protein